MSTIKNLTPAEVKTWQERIEVSKVWRQDEEAKWRRYDDYYQSKMLDLAFEDDQVVVNLVYPYVKIVIPAVYTKNPDISVLPRDNNDPLGQIKAAAMEDLLRYMIKTLRLKEEVKLCLMDAIITGMAWIKTGYQTVFETEVEEEAKTPLIDKALQMMGLVPKPEPASYSEEPNERVISEMPWALRVAPENMFVPAYAFRPETLPWLAERTIAARIDVENNPKWDPRVVERIKYRTDLNSLLGDRKIKLPEDHEEGEFAVLYEIHNLRNNTIFTIAEDVDAPLEQPYSNPYDFLPARHSYVMLRFNEVRNKFYCMPDVQSFEAQLIELNKIRTTMVVHRKRYNRRYVVTKDAFEETELNKLKIGEDGTYVVADVDDARAAMAPVQDASLPQDVYAIEQRIKDDITNISGQTDYQRGSLTQGAKTATEAAIVESQSKFRSEERLDIVSSFVLDTLENVAKICQNFMDQQHVFPVVGLLGAITWKKIDREGIQGDHLYNLIPGSMVPVNKDVDRQQYSELFSLLANDPFMDPVKVRTTLLEKYDIRNIQTFFNPQVAQLLQQRLLEALKNPSGGETPPETQETTSPAPAEASVPGAEPPQPMGGPMNGLRAPRPGGPGGGSIAPL